MLAAFQKEDLREYAAGRRGKYEEALEKMVEIPTVSVEPDRKATSTGARSLRFPPRVFRSKAASMKRRGIPSSTAARPGRNSDDHGLQPPDVQPADGPDWETPPFDS